MGLFDKLKDQALNSINGLGSIQKESVNNEQDQQVPIAPPPPQAPVVQSPMPQTTEKGEDGIYGNYMEHLIEMALADGELTEKEKQVLFKKAEANGIDLDEFEMVLDARLYEKQKAMQASKPIAHDSAPKSDKYGDVRKCPGCGAIVESLTTRCPDCGFEFNNVGANSSVKAFFEKMEQIEASRKESNSVISGLISSYSSITGLDKVTRQKSTLIANFPIPTSKEDILEFLTLAVPQAKKGGFFAQETPEQTHLRPIWKQKCEQIILKARFSMKDDKATLAEIEQFAKELKIK